MNILPIAIAVVNGMLAEFSLFPGYRVIDSRRS
jgi:hypothetical protein